MKKIITNIAAVFGFALIAVSSTHAQNSYTFTTGGASNITQTSAVISGVSSGAVTQTWMEITANGSVQRVGTISGAGSVSGTATGLRCGYTYSYQTAGVVAGGETNASYRQFTTSACSTGGNNGGNTGTYTFTTGGASNITQTSAVISGVSSGAVTQTWMEITANGSVQRVGTISGAGSVSGTATGLRCGYTYSYQTAGVVAGGETNASYRQFTTSACDVAVQTPRIVSFSASPSILNAPGNTTLSWSSENTNSCSITSIGAVNTNSSQSVNVSTTRTFTLSCVGTNGTTVSRDITVTVNQVQQNNFRINSFSASQTYLNTPGNTTLSWSTTDAATCSVTSLGNVNVNDSRQVYVSNTQTYILSCTGTNGGSDSRQVTVQVDNNNNNSNPVRVDSFTASPNPVTNGGYSTLYWSASNANRCEINGLASNLNASGNRSVGPIFGSQSYTIVCYGTNGGSDLRTVTVNTQNVCTFNCGGGNDNVNFTNFTANPTSVNAGGYSTLTWNTDADYCTASGDWSGNKSAPGSVQVGPIYGSKTYTLVCYKNGNQQSRSVNVFAGNEIENNSAITSIPTRISNTSAQLNGIALVGGGRFTEGWFEWGTTRDLGNVTNIRQIGNNATNNFAESLVGLNANNTYFYRAVIRNANGTSRGDIVRFQTAAVVVFVNPTPIRPTTVRPVITPIIPIAQTYGRPAFMEVLVSGLQSDVFRAGSQEFQVSYRSLTQLTLVNAAIKVVLPEEFEYVSATRGVYSTENRTLTLNLGDVRPSDNGVISVRVNVSAGAQVGKTTVTTGYGNYTVPANANFLAYQDEVVAYALATIREGNILPQTGSVASAGFFGTELGTAFGWLLLLLILLAIIFMLRKLYVSFTDTQKA